MLYGGLSTVRKSPSEKEKTERTFEEAISELQKHKSQLLMRENSKEDSVKGIAELDATLYGYKLALKEKRKDMSEAHYARLKAKLTHKKAFPKKDLGYLVKGATELQVEKNERLAKEGKKSGPPSRHHLIDQY